MKFEINMQLKNCYYTRVIYILVRPLNKSTSDLPRFFLLLLHIHGHLHIMT